MALPLIWLPTFGGSQPAQASPTGIQVASNIGNILASICRSIVSASITTGASAIPQVATAQNVKISLTAQPFPAAGAPQFLVIPGQQRDIASAIDGGGRYVNLVEGEFDIVVLDRSARDIVEIDTIRLIDVNNGLYMTTLALIDAIDQKFPLDLSGNFLTIETVRHIFTGRPQLYGKSFEWCGMPTSWRVIYNRAVTLGI
jgi:hypothetical protein